MKRNNASIRSNLQPHPSRSPWQRSRSMHVSLLTIGLPGQLLFQSAHRNQRFPQHRPATRSEVVVNGTHCTALRTRTCSPNCCKPTLERGPNQHIQAAPPARRDLLTRASALLLTQLVAQQPAEANVQVPTASIRLDLAPKQSSFDPTDERLRDAAALLQRALNAEEVQVCQPHAAIGMF